ncbi:uncharacterized protein G2W53_003659 [Senna tora]|uniref:Uncharacterized protein n=1 Tax=Senna tora TaxID=362788 RepID=A0A835CFY9_9FABA|nr:uncharacterized protein G2W53_003659 [Senna tora]
MEATPEASSNRANKTEKLLDVLNQKDPLYLHPFWKSSAEIMPKRSKRATTSEELTPQKAKEHVEGRKILQERPFSPDDRFQFHQQITESGLLQLVQPCSEGNLAYVRNFYSMAKLNRMGDTGRSERANLLLQEESQQQYLHLAPLPKPQPYALVPFQWYRSRPSPPTLSIDETKAR